MTENSSTSKNLKNPKLKVKLNFKSIRSHVVPILKYLEVGEYKANIACMLNMSKPHVDYYVEKLERVGFVRREKRSNIVCYEVTLEGKNFLTGTEQVLLGSRVWRLHAAKYRYSLVSDGVWPADWRKVAMTNWTALLGLEGGVTVEHTPSSVIIHVETLYGADPVLLLDAARTSADRTAKALMQKYSCRLSEGKLCRKPHIAIDDPVAEFMSRYFEISTNNSKMDRSEGVGEIDHFAIENAVNYLLLPEHVKKLEDKFELMNCKFEKMSTNLERLTGILGKLCDKETSETALSNLRDKSYVS
jgi:predicted transcriptional regulator